MLIFKQVERSLITKGTDIIGTYYIIIMTAEIFLLFSCKIKKTRLIGLNHT